MTSDGALFLGAELIGSSNAVRFANTCGQGDFRPNFRRIGLAVSGQTIPGLHEEVKKAHPKSSSCVVFIGVNDLIAFTRDVLALKITITGAQNKLRTSTKYLLMDLLQAFPAGVTFIETLACPGLSQDREWHRIFGKLRYAIMRTVRAMSRQVRQLAVCEVNEYLRLECYEPVMGYRFKRRDFIHLNANGHRIVANLLRKIL